MRLIIHRIRQRFEEERRDESKFLRLPIIQACALLSVILAMMEGYTFAFLLEPWCFILPCYPLINFLIGLAALIKGRSLLSTLYFIALLPTIVPLGIIIYYTGYVHSNSGDWNYLCADGFTVCKQYIFYLEKLPRGTVLAATIVGCFAIPVYALTLLAFRRLKLYQNALTSTPVHTSNAAPVPEMAVSQPTPNFPHHTPPAMFIPEPPPAYSGPDSTISFGAPPALFQPTPSSGDTVQLPNKKGRESRKMSL